MTTHSDVLPLIDKATWVSFDVFDTLIERSVSHYVHAFSVLHEALADRNWMAGINREEFVRRRMRAERLARRQKFNDISSVEVSLHDIWARFDLDLGGRVDVDDAIAAEIAIETSLINVRHNGKELFDYARSKGKTVIAVSDMYHSTSTISEWLTRHGFEMHHVFVSGDMGSGKRDGLLGLVVRQLNLDPKKGLHIGDKHDVDGIGAQRVGMKAAVLPHPHDHIRPVAPPTNNVTPVLESAIVARAVNGYEPDSGDARALGFAYLGPMVAGFTAYALHTARAHDLDFLSFTSRDCKMLDDVTTEFVRTPAGSHGYLHFSRRSLYLPALAGGISDHDMGNLTGGLWATPVRDYFSRIDLDVDTYRDVLAHHDLSPDSVIHNKNSRYLLSLVFRDIERDVVEIATTRLSELSEYLRHTGLLEAHRVGFVDVGWRGSVQASLERCLRLIGWHGHLEGIYVGLLWASHPLNDQTMSAWLTSFPRHRQFHAALAGAVPAVEAMFQANEPSVSSYVDGLPVLRGPVHSREIIDHLQHGARDFISTNEKLITRLFTAGQPDHVLAQPLMRLLTHPTVAEARLLGSVLYADGFGENAEVRTILRPVTGKNKVASQARESERRITQWRAGFDVLSSESN